MSGISVPIPGLISHTRKVQSLYKKTLRNLQSYYDRRPTYRYQAVLMRQRFDQNRDIKDMREAKELVLKGEQELFSKQHYCPVKFPHSPGGSCYERVVIPPDWVLDYWHPLEKAQYPNYFACREHRKKEYIDKWDTKYAKSDTRNDEE